MRFHKVKSFMIKLVFGLCTFAFTVFVFANAYEEVANVDLPLGFSLRRYEAQKPVQKIIDEFSIKIDTRSLNDNARLGELDVLVIPELNIRLPLEEARIINGEYYQKVNFGQYVGLNSDDFGNTVDYLVYVDQSWRTIPLTEEIEDGMSILVYTKKGFQADFVVDSRSILSMDQSFIVSKSDRRQLILIVENPEINRYYGYSLISSR